MKIAGFKIKKKNHSHKLLYTLGSATIAIVAYGLIRGIPDLIRYIKIRQM